MKTGPKSLVDRVIWDQLLATNAEIIESFRLKRDKVNKLISSGTCQNKISADQYHMTISQAQVYNSSRLRVFFEVDH